jgi:hypothetical protein
MSDRTIFQPTLLASAVAAIFSLGPAAVRAAPDPAVGPVFTLVAPRTGGAPLALARSDSGVFVLGWMGYSLDALGNPDVYNNSIGFFSGDGIPLNAEIKLSDALYLPTLVGNHGPKIGVAADADGDFVASWVSGNPKRIYTQRFSQDGTAQGNAVTVGPAPQVASPSIVTDTDSLMMALDGDGDLAIGWSVTTSAAFGWCWGNFYTGWIHGCIGGDHSTTYASVYNTSGSTMRWTGTGVYREPSTAVFQSPVSLLPQPGGSFIALFRPSPADGTGYYLSAQPLNSHAQKSGASWTATGPNGNEKLATGITSAAADANGNIAIVWNSVSGVYVRRYSANGTPLGDWMSIADNTSCFDPIIEMTPSGSFAVLRSAAINTSPCGIEVQYFNADGSPHGAAVDVTDTEYVTYYSPPAAAIDSNGVLTVVWPEDNGGVMGRNITPPN